MIDPKTKKVCACPLNGKVCSDGIREDFPLSEDKINRLRCRWWQHIYGKDPQTEKLVDEFDCSIAWLPVTTVETSQMAHQTSASVDKVANVMNRNLSRMVRGMIAVARRQGLGPVDEPKKLSEGGRANGRDKT